MLMSDQFVYDKEGTIIVYAKPHFEEYTIPKEVINITDGNQTKYVFMDVSKQNETFELNFQENSELLYIGNYAFYSCSQLIKINFDNAKKLKTIGEKAFANCKNLRSLDFTYSYNLIGFLYYGSFTGCSSLSSVTIPDNSKIETISSGTFRSTAITSFKIPKSCSYVRGESFGFCNIDQFTVETGNIHYSVYKGSLYNYEKTVLVCYRATNDVLELPEQTTTIGTTAFDGYPHSLLIPKQITTYYKMAFYVFYGTSITFMRPPDVIQANMFYYNPHLKAFYFFDSVSVIEEDAFIESNSIRYIYFIMPVTQIHENAFPFPEKICFAGNVESVKTCLPHIHIQECKLSFNDLITCYCKGNKYSTSLRFLLIIFITMSGSNI